MAQVWLIEQDLSGYPYPRPVHDAPRNGIEAEEWVARFGVRVYPDVIYFFAELKDPEEIDHKELLRKYIEHVGECEGTVFLADHHRDEELFTDEQWSALQKLGGY